MQLLVSTSLAQDKLAHDCGFEQVVPRMWVGPVNSFSPYDNRFIGWDAMWMEEAPGLSLDLLAMGKARVIGSEVRTMIDRKDLEELLYTK